MAVFKEPFPEFLCMGYHYLCINCVCDIFMFKVPQTGIDFSVISYLQKINHTIYTQYVCK